MSNKARSRKQKQSVKDFQNQLVEDMKCIFAFWIHNNKQQNGKL